MLITRVDPAKLEAFAILRREGQTRDEITRALGICRRTYFYWLAELRRIEHEARKLMRTDA